MRYRLCLTAVLIGLMSSVSWGIEISHSVESFISKGSQFQMGWVRQDNQTYYNAAFSTNFSLMDLQVSSAVNAYFPSSGTGATPVTWTFKKVKYEFENTAGVQWGWLTDVSLGQGLLMDHYDTGSGGNTAEFTPQKSGVKGYLNLNPVRIDGLYTARELYGAHVGYTLFQDSFILGSPVVVGGTYINDRKGVKGGLAQSGYAADIALPIGGDFLTAFIESAWLENHGNGQSTGIRGDFFGMFSYRGEYRLLGPGFVPGYFGRVYEQGAPTFPTSTDTSGGAFVSVGSSWFDGYIQTDFQYEQYRSDTLLTGAAGWKPIFGVAGVVHYTQPFKGNISPVLDAELLISGSSLDTIVDVRQVYASTGTETSYSLGGRVSLTKLMGLPF